MIGETIDGRYRLLGVLGEGGMGAVYEAEHTGTGRRVALKLVSAEMAKRPETMQRFHREARVVGAIETQHIVQVLDTGTEPSGRPYMVMELLRGEDFQTLLTRLGAISPELALTLVGQACVGLAKAHEAGVVHRDIKPANLFLARRDDGDLIVKIVDFGIAKIKMDLFSSQDVALTTTGTIVGSPMYMSPEQAMGRKTIDARTDVWSLGTVLYQALAGQIPHAGCTTVGELIMAICSQPARPIRELVPWVPEEVALITQRALAIDPNARTPSIAAMLASIRALVPERLALRADMLVPFTPPHVPAAPQQAAPSPGPPVASAAATAAFAPPAAELTLDLAPHGVAPPAAAAAPAELPFASDAPLQFELAAPVQRHQRYSRSEHVVAPPARGIDLSSLRGPIQIVLLGAAVSVGDWIYTRVTGDMISVASIRPVWVAGSLVALGIVLGLWRLVSPP